MENNFDYTPYKAGTLMHSSNLQALLYLRACVPEAHKPSLSDGKMIIKAWRAEEERDLLQRRLEDSHGTVKLQAIDNKELEAENTRLKEALQVVYDSYKGLYADDVPQVLLNNIPIIRNALTNQ